MSLQSICDAIMRLVEKARPPLAEISPVLILCDAVKRPGLSAKTLAANIIRRQAEAGAPMGSASDGTQNIMEAMEVIRAEEYLKMLKLNGRVDITIPAGAIKIQATGANAAGPVTVIGTSITDVGGKGIVR